MAKNQCRGHWYTPSDEKGQQIGIKRESVIAKDLKKPKSKQMGPRSFVLEAYKKTVGMVL